VSPLVSGQYPLAVAPCIETGLSGFPSRLLCSFFSSLFFFFLPFFLVLLRGIEWRGKPDTKFASRGDGKGDTKPDTRRHQRLAISFTR